MIGSLQLQYNRGRQAVITNELIDIITVNPLPISNLSELMLCRVPRRCKEGQWLREKTRIAVNAAWL